MDATRRSPHWRFMHPSCRCNQDATTEYEIVNGTPMNSTSNFRILRPKKVGGEEEARLVDGGVVLGRCKREESTADSLCDEAKSLQRSCRVLIPAAGSQPLTAQLRQSIAPLNRLDARAQKRASELRTQSHCHPARFGGGSGDLIPFRR